MKTIIFLSYTDDEAEKVLELIRQSNLEQGLTSQFNFELSVCIAEVINNLVEHTPEQHKQQNPVFELHFTNYPDGVCVQIVNQSPEYEFVQPQQAPSETDLSGRGLFILNQWIDTLSYRHQDGKNYLLMFKQNL